MLPQELEKQQQIGKILQKMAIRKIAINSLAEANKESKADIKEVAGRGIMSDSEINNAVEAIVDRAGLINKANEKVTLAEEGIAISEILKKYFEDLNMQDEADKYQV